MKTSLIALSLLCVGSTALAQTDANRVWWNNEPYLVICTCTHPGTGANRQWVGTVDVDYLPAGLAGGTGAGMNSTDVGYKIHKANGYERCAAGPNSTATVVGFQEVCRFSAATSGTHNPWIHRVRITGVVPDTGSPHANSVAPDLTNVLADFGAGIVAPFTQTRTWRATRACATCAAQNGGVYTGNGGNPFSLNLNGDTAMVYDFVGGEMDDTAHNAAPNGVSQDVVGSWQTGSPSGGTTANTNYEQFGFLDTATGILWRQSDVNAVQTTSDFFNKWITFLQAESSMSVFSDWGRRRNTAAGGMRGNGDGSYHADLASHSGTMGVQVSTSGAAGDTAIVVLDPTGSTTSCVAVPGAAIVAGATGTAFIQQDGWLLGLAVEVASIGNMTSGNERDLLGPDPGIGVPQIPGSIGSSLTVQVHILKGFSIIPPALSDLSSTEVRRIIIES